MLKPLIYKDSLRSILPFSTYLSSLFLRICLTFSTLSSLFLRTILGGFRPYFKNFCALVNGLSSLFLRTYTNARLPTLDQGTQ